MTTKSGRDRIVPIALALRDHLDAHLLNLPWQQGLLFGLRTGFRRVEEPSVNLRCGRSFRHDVHHDRRTDA